jgi:hypothetical protein
MSTATLPELVPLVIAPASLGSLIRSADDLAAAFSGAGWRR